MNPAETEVVHRGPVLVFAREEAHLHTVDEPVTPALLHRRLGAVGLVVPEVVGAQHTFDGLDAEGYLRRVV